MVISANHFKDVTNGYERRTDGLWVHRGNVQARDSFFDVGSVRVSKNLMPPGGYTGEGMELLYAGTGAAGQAYIQVFDRVAGQLRPLNISASAVNLPDGSVWTNEIGDGAVTTPKIAANAVSALIGSFVGTFSWSTAATGAWMATTLAASFTTGGGLCRIEASVPMVHTANGGAFYYGLFADASFLTNLGYWGLPTAGSPQVPTMTYYHTFPAGAHSVAFGVYSVSAGTLSIWNGSNSTLYVTEQKR